MRKGAIEMSERKWIVVTGGSRGLGAAICRALAKNGFNLVINCKSNVEKAEGVKKE